MTNIGRIYISQVKRKITVSSPAKKAFLHTLKQNVTTYLTEHPNTSYNCIIENFGTPQEVADSYYEMLEENEIKQHTTFRKACILACCIALLTLTVACGWYYHQTQGTIPTYVMEEVKLGT